MAAQLQILVNGVPFDLLKGETERFYVTKQIHDLANLETRDADFSKTIDVPLTANNISILGRNIPQIDRFDQERVTDLKPCEVLIKGVPIISDAFILVGTQSQNANTISITVVGGTSLFFNQLRERPLSDLDFTELNIEWSLPGIAPIMENTTGIVYGQSQWYQNKSRALYEVQNGNDALTFLNEMELGESGFAIYLHTILDKIFSNLSNISVDTSNMDATFFTLALQVNSPVIHNSFGAIEGTLAEVAITNYQAPAEVPPTWLATRVPFDTVLTDPEAIWNAPTFEFILKSAGLYLARIVVTGTQPGAASMNIAIRRDGQTIASVNPISETINEAVDVAVNGVVGQAFSVLIGGSTEPNNININFSMEKQGEGSAENIDVATLLPEMTQKAFVKEVFKLQNIVPIEENGVINLKYWETIKDEPPISLELNKRLETSLRGTLVSYARTNFMAYNINPLVERTDTTGQFPVNNETLVDELVKILSLFSASDISLIAGNAGLSYITVPAYSMEYKFVTDNKVTVAAGSIVFTTQDRNDIKAGDFISMDHGGAIDRRRVVVMTSDFSGQVDVSWSTNANETDFAHWFFSSNNVQSHVVNVESLGNTDLRVWNGGQSQIYPNYKQTTFTGLSWEQLKDVYYPLLIASVKKPFIVIAWIEMSVITYVSIDGLQPIYLEEYDAYFYANKIEQWKYNGSTRVELIQISR